MYTCVIVSWDAKCQASDEWISRMTRNLTRGRDQPFYNILTDDGNAAYVAEGNFTQLMIFNLSLSKIISLSLFLKTI